MTKWDDLARAVQRDVRWDEGNQPQNYTDEEAKQAAVHTRQDLVLFVVHLSSINRQLSGVRILLVLVVAALVAIALRLYI